MYLRRIIKIRADDSPNVRARKLIVPGVVTWEAYQQRRFLWDKVKQCIALDAEFYEGPEELLFPPVWLNRAEEIADQLQGQSRHAKAIGIDPAEGGDKTAMAAIDEHGLIELVSCQTPDTARITGDALAFIRKHKALPENVCFDRGGGGKEHADRLRSQGYEVRTVAFGESISLEPKRGIRLFGERVEHKEDRYVYVNRRAEMYGTLSNLLDPALNPQGFAISREYADLRKQLAVIRKEYDSEGRLMLPPKHRKPGQQETKVKTLVELIGHSPDEADALVIAVFAMTNQPVRARAGAMW